MFGGITLQLLLTGIGQVWYSDDHRNVLDCVELMSMSYIHVILSNCGADLPLPPKFESPQRVREHNCMKDWAVGMEGLVHASCHAPLEGLTLDVDQNIGQMRLFIAHLEPPGRCMGFMVNQADLSCSACSLIPNFTPAHNGGGLTKERPDVRSGDAKGQTDPQEPSRVANVHTEQCPCSPSQNQPAVQPERSRSIKNGAAQRRMQSASISVTPEGATCCVAESIEDTEFLVLWWPRMSPALNTRPYLANNNGPVYAPNFPLGVLAEDQISRRRRFLILSIQVFTAPSVNAHGQPGLLHTQSFFTFQLEDATRNIIFLCGKWYSLREKQRFAVGSSRIRIIGVPWAAHTGQMVLSSCTETYRGVIIGNTGVDLAIPLRAENRTRVEWVQSNWR
ncbi:hypothetical protein B0H16DRAFT_1775766 [Mycena metata]|uniref:Uncharacterized protein n=1 Tax=Mycena metata TaxID=1033252 RepID=A0AAD7HW85_9AGAR|nr:hypothetical protein B0H16DRAFT_1775766 [Mycena metata]